MIGEMLESRKCNRYSEEIIKVLGIRPYGRLHSWRLELDDGKDEKVEMMDKKYKRIVDMLVESDAGERIVKEMPRFQKAASLQ